MRLTLAWLSVCLAIYCGHGNVVLSLPPSLIATATNAALSSQHPQQHPQQQQEKKDARVLYDSGSGALREMLHTPNSGKGGMGPEEERPQLSEDFNRNADDLGARQPQSAPQEIAPEVGLGMEGLGMGLGLGPSYRATPPHRYWSNRCQGRGGSLCPQEYYRTRLAARNKDALTRLHLQLSSMPESSAEDSPDTESDSQEPPELEEDDDNDEDANNNDVFMLLTGEQDLIKFLHWAMQLLYPYQQRPLGNLSDGAAENYYPGMFLWKKLNLSGHLEPPLIVDEPQYVLVRREKLFDGYHWGDELSKESDPFIPPRGRKHNSPDLDALMNRYEPFMPNRGKRDKVKDLFKYDDLFYPHRGKKHRNLFQVDDPFFATRGKKLQLRDLYNVDDPFVPNRGKRHLAGGKRWWQEDDSGNDSNNWPQRMSTHKANGNDQSARPSLSSDGEAFVPSAAYTSWRLPANRLLPAPRSMSSDQQQLQWQLPHGLHFVGNPNNMRQQVKTRSWNGEHRLRRRSPGDALGAIAQR